MRQRVLSGIFGILIGIGIGAGAMRLFDAEDSKNSTADNPKQPGGAEASDPEGDPVVSALDANKFFEQIAGGQDKWAEYQISSFGGAHEQYGYAVWEAEPLLDDKALQERVVAALKATIAAGGGEPITEKNVSIGAVKSGTHELHYFICSYFFSSRMREATVCVTAPLEGKQYSASILFGR